MLQKNTNPNKTTVVPFTKKKRVKYLLVPTIQGVKLAFVNNVTFLSVLFYKILTLRATSKTNPYGSSTSIDTLKNDSLVAEGTASP